MKKALCILLSIFLLMVCTGCAGAISHPSGTAVRICYDRENVSFDLELSQEEATAVLSVLNGKRRDLDMTVTGAGCGFGREQAFIINGSTYCLAQDGCDVIWEEGTDSYYVVSDQEMNQLKEIFKAHGAKII
jgi:hypothetical protein